MKSPRKNRKQPTQVGIALLISIFVLLLISVVAIALIVSSGTETALAGNYRASTSVYYAASAGLEEVRGRLWVKNPNSFANTDPGFIPPSLAMCSPLYVINRQGSETVTPWVSGSTYEDKEYTQEFVNPGLCSTPSSPPTANSVWNNSPLNTLTFQNPTYKWVRINAVSGKSLGVSVDGGSPGISTVPMYYTGSGYTANPSNGTQVLEITSFAVLPNGQNGSTQKTLQYLVALSGVSLVFPAAMILDGYSDLYSGPNHNNFQVSGNQDGSDSACGGPLTPYPVQAIGVPDWADVNNVISGNSPAIGIPSGQGGNYTGSPGTTPNVTRTGLATNFQTVQSLNQLVQSIAQNADSVIVGPATQSDLPSAISSTPMTVVIQGNPAIPSQGNLSLSGGFNGYGLLVVTGNFTYTPDTNWSGIVLVIGQGSVSTISGGSGGTFNGAILIAQTRDTAGNPLTGPNPGPATFNDSTTSTVGRGYFYNCYWIQTAQPKASYKVLSFQEIAQQ